MTWKLKNYYHIKKNKKKLNIEDIILAFGYSQ